MSQQYFPVWIVDLNGQPITSFSGGGGGSVTLTGTLPAYAAPPAVTFAGGNGTDYSANAATVPGGSALVTIPVTSGRNYVEVQNQSAVTLQLVRDDGAGGNVTSIFLASGGGAGSQGAGWSSSTFKGRVRVFGTAGSQVAAYQE